MAFARINYHSRSLQKAPSVSVVFPDDPEIPRPYSVFYLLHGLSDDDTIWMRRTSIERYVEGCRWSWSCPMEAGASTPTQSSAAPMWRQPMVRTGRPRKPGGGNPTSGVGPQGGEPPRPNLGREADDPSARLLMPMALFSIPPLFAALLGGWVAGRFSTRRGFGRLAQES